MRSPQDLAPAIRHPKGPIGTRLLVCLALAVLAGCAGETSQRPAPRTAAQVEAGIAALLPTTVASRAAWASDLQLIFAALKLDPSDTNVCAVLAVTEQESTFRADPAVPQLGRIAREEMLRRADQAGVPAVAVNLALRLNSPNGLSWDERIASVRTERELSNIYEEFIDQVPLGKRMLAGYNPVRTGGPMQVSIAFAEAHQQIRPYPFPMSGTLRHEVFTRRGGLYFGTAHLLDYASPYGRQMIFRFADFNAGQYASRNAAFQQAVSTASGRALDLDGDLLLPGTTADSPAGQTESALRTLQASLGLDTREIRRQLLRADAVDFDNSTLYQRVFLLAEQRGGKRLPRAQLPRIELKSPKITRSLTTEWFARRVDERFQRCLKRATE